MPRPDRTAQRRFIAIAAPATLVAGILGAGSAAAVPPQLTSPPRAATAAPTQLTSTVTAATATTAATARPKVPKLAWKACFTAFQCAKAKVPLDYSKPRGRTITIALMRLRATDRAHRIGSLFVNPGGPGDPDDSGDSGVEFIQTDARQVYSAKLRARFDIVGFDPRFSGASGPFATCATNREMGGWLDEYYVRPPFPFTPAQELKTHSDYQKYTALCAKHSPFLAYASTANVARDLDLLRQAVHDKKLSYVGYSYGSILGQTYAALFPKKVRTLTIDGVLDAKKWSTGTPEQSKTVPFTTRIDSALGASAAFDQFTALCDKAGPVACPFTKDGQAREKFDALANRLKTDPYPVLDGDGLMLDYSLLVDHTLGALSGGPQSWHDSSVTLQETYRGVFGTQPPSAAVADGGLKNLIQRAKSTPRWAAPGTTIGAVGSASMDTPVDNGLAAFSAVVCSDTVNPRSESAWAAAGAAQDLVAPYFGRYWTWAGEQCASWKLPSKGRYLGPYNKATSAPVLVIGTTYDPATPYSGAVAVASRIPKARLLTINGYGHTSLAGRSACAKRVFEKYTLTGRPPARDTVCEQDVAPFSK
jgi:pimeloyl-ACP methyl ester carboxylesterase